MLVSFQPYTKNGWRFMKSSISAISNWNGVLKWDVLGQLQVAVSTLLLAQVVTQVALLDFNLEAAFTVHSFGWSKPHLLDTLYFTWSSAGTNNCVYIAVLLVAQFKENIHGEAPFVFAFTVLSFQHYECIARVLPGCTGCCCDSGAVPASFTQKRYHCAAIFST